MYQKASLSFLVLQLLYQYNKLFDYQEMPKM